MSGPSKEPSGNTTKIHQTRYPSVSSCCPSWNVQAICLQKPSKYRSKSRNKADSSAFPVDRACVCRAAAFALHEDGTGSSALDCHSTSGTRFSEESLRWARLRWARPKLSPSRGGSPSVKLGVYILVECSWIGRSWV